MSAEKLINAFRGRASRLQFWVVVAIVVPALMVLLLAFWVYALSIPGAYENGGPTPMPTDPIGIAGVILWFTALAGFAAAFLAAAIRRLHDRGKAWWWIFVFLFLPDVLFAYGRHLVDISMGAAGEMPFVAFIYPAFALYLWGMAELGFLRGTVGDNCFGPDPLAK